jgi:hypothetical protein
MRSEKIFAGRKSFQSAFKKKYFPAEGGIKKTAPPSAAKIFFALNRSNDSK